MLNSVLSPTAPKGEKKPPHIKPVWCPRAGGSRKNWVSCRTLQRSIMSVVANSFVPTDFLVDGQVSELGTVHPLLTLSFLRTWILPLHVVVVEEEVVVIRNG